MAFRFRRVVLKKAEPRQPSGGWYADPFGAKAASLCILSTTICVSGEVSRIRGIARRLDSPGILRSRIRTRGR